jgi:hypothetical protein
MEVANVNSYQLPNDLFKPGQTKPTKPPKEKKKKSSSKAAKRSHAEAGLDVRISLPIEPVLTRETLTTRDRRNARPFADNFANLGQRAQISKTAGIREHQRPAHADSRIDGSFLEHKLKPSFVRYSPGPSFTDLHKTMGSLTCFSTQSRFQHPPPKNGVLIELPP